jgi:hypothetical protein
MHAMGSGCRESFRRCVHGARLVSLVLAAGVALGERVGAAQPSAEGPPLPIRLTVDAPAGCPGRAAFLAQVKGYAARVREALPGEAAREIQVEMRSADDEFMGTLTMTEPDGTGSNVVCPDDTSPAIVCTGTACAGSGASCLNSACCSGLRCCTSSSHGSNQATCSATCS